MVTWDYLFILYFILVILTVIKIIFDTQDQVKALFYIFITVVFPVFGILIYFSFGINYRKNKMFSKKIFADTKLQAEVAEKIRESIAIKGDEDDKTLIKYYNLIRFQANADMAPLTQNSVTLLNNGEAFFPELLASIETARHHIHVEFYIWEDDKIGNRLKALLIKKANEGVTVRVIYDDFGASGIKHRIRRELHEGGVEIYPFYKIRLIMLANRLNYRDHRKIVVIDGKTGFTGGINVSDKYINGPEEKKGKIKYWRDTGIKIVGPAVNSLQRNFIANWNFCSGTRIPIEESLFPIALSAGKYGDDYMQIIASGPDSDFPYILYSCTSAIYNAKRSVYITTPYFIPHENIMAAIIKAALSGIDCRIILPGISDSAFVNAATKSFVAELLKAGVRVYFYQKGFVHSKTMTVDEDLSIIGTANMDNRSFELNFEINSVIYSTALTRQLIDVFDSDLLDSTEVKQDEWSNRFIGRKFLNKIARLFSPLL